MTDLDDVELGKSLPVEPPRRRRGWLIAVIVAVVLIFQGVVLFYYLRPGEEQPPPESNRPEEPSAEPAPAVSAKEEGLELGDLPALDRSDSAVRQLAAGFSSHPLLSNWLQEEGLLRRFAVAVDNVAEGLGPSSHLPFLAPEEAFQAVAREGRFYIAPESYARFDLVADVFASLDTQRCGAAYRFLRPLIGQAYRDLGYPHTRFEDTLKRAIQRLLDTPQTPSEVEVIPAGGLGYEYADPELEDLAPVQKALLRMGPRNRNKIQQKLRELAQALAVEDDG